MDLGLELLEDLPDMAAVLVPIGGGGLISGITSAIKQRRPDVTVIGVEATGSANMSTSRRAGQATDLEAVDTIADGLATKKTDPEVFAIIDELVDDFATVTDEEIVEAIAFLLERAKLMAETAGASAAAALLSGKVQLPKDTVTVAMVCGGNFDVAGKLKFTSL